MQRLSLTMMTCFTLFLIFLISPSYGGYSRSLTQVDLSDLKDPRIKPSKYKVSQQVRMQTFLSFIIFHLAHSKIVGTPCILNCFIQFFNHTKFNALTMNKLNLVFFQFKESELGTRQLSTEKYYEKRKCNFFGLL